MKRPWQIILHDSVIIKDIGDPCHTVYHWLHLFDFYFFIYSHWDYSLSYCSFRNVSFLIPFVFSWFGRCCLIVAHNISPQSILCCCCWALWRVRLACLVSDLQGHSGQSIPSRDMLTRVCSRLHKVLNRYNDLWSYNHNYYNVNLSVRYIYLLLSECEFSTASYGPNFFPSFYGPSAECVGHEHKEGKNEDP